jgi:long-chain fatty acid transport protein
MTKRLAVKKLFQIMCAAGIMGVSSHAMASAFQLWEQDGASVGNYHAGRAALANDASIAYYNPAGITMIKNQQIVVADDAILSDIKYRGTVATNTFHDNTPYYTVAQGGGFSQVPSFHYVAPLSENIGFGLSLAVPFGLKTDYGNNTPMRFAATTTQLQVVDLTPALGINLTKKLSVGAGVDIQRMSARFDQVDTIGPGTDTNDINKGWDTAWGYRAGLLYQFTPETRAGLTYNSQVVHHFRGTSKFEGHIANDYNIAAAEDPELAALLFATPSPFYSRETNASLTLPAFTTLSGYHKLNDQWAVMATAIYTQWNVVQNITLKDVAGIKPSPIGAVGANDITVNLPAYYRNTWNLSVGTDYYATDKVTLRGGVGYDETPVTNTYRAIEIPDNNRIAVALGGHFQATKTLGFDLGWTHLFMLGTTTIAPPVQVSGAQQVTTRGSVQASADIFGAQVTWDLV